MNRSILMAWDFFGVINATDNLGPLLQQLMDEGAEHIIVSHSSKSEIEVFLRSQELSQYFTTIYGSEWHMTDATMGKKAALMDYITAHGPFEIKVMIGDSLGDMVDGKAAGMVTCLFDPDGFYARSEHGADFRINDLIEIVGIAKMD